MPPRPVPSQPRAASAPVSASRPLWGGLYARHGTALLCALIFLAVLLAYGPALHGGFIWDDDGHVTRPDLRSLAGLGRIWFEIGATQQYYPILHSAFWIEHHLWGDAALGYHLLNILLHATAAYLFAVLLRRLAVSTVGGALRPDVGRSPLQPTAENAHLATTSPRDRTAETTAWLAALLFALHPVCVESVAWISEQKNTLSLVFYLCAALAYLRFAQGENENDHESARNPTSPFPFPSRAKRAYFLATALFLLALLTKTVTATLPAALLVVFWWQRGRLEFRRDVLPLLPWLAAGAAAGLFTARFERVLIGAQGADFSLGFLERLLLAGRTFWFYLGKLAWPADLMFVYPRWTIDASHLAAWLPLLAALALFGLLLFWRRRSRAPLAAGLLFAGALFPVLGFFNVFPFVFSYVADHFQYLASLPVFALASAGLVRLAVRLPSPVRVAGATALLAVLGALSWRQGRMYRGATTLYETTLRQNPGAWLAAHNLAIIYAGAGRVPEAIALEEKVLRLRPDYALAENNLGDDFLRLGRPADAVAHLERAVQLQSDYALAHRNLGLALAMTDRVAAALPHFERAAQLDPSDAEAELDWAMALLQTGRTAAAVPHFERAVSLNPHSADAHLAFAQALRQLDRPAEAGEHELEARRLQSAPK